MTLEQRVFRTMNRLAVIERIVSLEGVAGAVHVQPLNQEALSAGLSDLIQVAYDDPTPIRDAPFEITNWEPGETGGTRATPPAGG